LTKNRDAGEAGLATILALAFIILGVLAAGLVGIAIHQDPAPAHKTVKAAPVDVTPPGFKRISDGVDQLSIAIPIGWQTVPVTTGSLTDALKSFEATNPELRSLIDPAVAASGQYQVGTFALDSLTRTILFTFGTDVPAGTSIDAAPIGDFAREVTRVGGQNVRTSRVQLPVGRSYQLAFELTVKGVTVAEMFNIFVHANRVVFLEMVSPVGVDRSGLYRQVQESLETTG
jgi:hypothetical protein